jgi:membrane protease YdiL (CAAX protease family)
MARVKASALPVPPAGDDTRPVRSICALTTLGIGVLVTAIALPESWQGWPYAPFPIVHACLAIAVPLWLGLGPTRQPCSEIRTWLPRQGPPLVAAIVFIGGFILVYSQVLVALDKTQDPMWNVIVTYSNFEKLFVDRYGRSTTLIVSYVFLGLWPMFGEELFYRGFLFHTLMHHTSSMAAGIVTSVLFGLRHAAQLAYLAPTYPVAAGVAYFVWAFGVSALWCWVYARTHSLWLCIASHGVNVILAPVVLAILDR